MKTKKVSSVLLISVFAIALLSVTLPDGGDWAVPDKYKNMENTQVGVDDADEIGAELWKTHCKSCHGKEGYGDGTKSEELDAGIRDFSDEEFQAQNDGELYYKAFVGRDEMPNFEKKITDEEDRWLLVNYMRSLKE